MYQFDEPCMISEDPGEIKQEASPGIYYFPSSIALFQKRSIFVTEVYFEANPGK